MTASLPPSLPPAPQSFGPYQTYAITDPAEKMLYISGVIPWASTNDAFQPRNVQYTGNSYNKAQKEDAAKQAAWNLISSIEKACQETGTQFERMVKLNGYIATHSSFTQQPDVMNAASNVIKEHYHLPDEKMGARTGVSVPVLPLNATVELDAIVAVKDIPKAGVKFRGLA